MKLTEVVLVLLSVTCMAWADGCPPCDPNSCSEPVNCVAGLVPDQCNCCKECGLAEGELCDLDTSTYLYGQCGENLECRDRTDVPGEATCFCKYSETLCGTDGKTYRNLCNLRETVVLKDQEDLKVAAKGPCKSAPRIVSGPSHQKNHTGVNVDLSCEAEGYPIPAIDWVFTRSNDKAIRLPEDDPFVNIYTRGGPEKYRVSGWIQIMNIEKRHEGDYTCFATNSEGKAKAEARVIVLGEDDERDRDL